MQPAAVEKKKQEARERSSSRDGHHGEEWEPKKILEKVEMVKTRNPETIHYVERKLTDKGLSRMDRHPGDGLGIQKPPPKSGHGGKYTWEGPVDPMESELDPVPPAIDPRDPNYVDEDEAVLAEEEEEAPPVIGEVEVAKVAEAKEGVSRIEVQPPLQPVVFNTSG